MANLRKKYLSVMRVDHDFHSDVVPCSHSSYCIEEIQIWQLPIETGQENMRRLRAVQVLRHLKKIEKLQKLIKTK